MDEILFLILGFIIYVLLYAFASFLFSYKVYLIQNNKYILSALMSGFAVFINFSLYAFVPLLTIAISWYWAVVLISALAISSFFANAVLGRVDLAHSKRDKKEVK